MAPSVPLREGRRVFGADPATFNRARPGYPDRVYEILRTRCGLTPGARVFEVGAGTGIATRGLLDQGARPLTVIEPDRRMARYLLGTLGPRRDRVHPVLHPFETASLPTASFDLGVAATSFHWISERAGLRRVARLLRPGGWWAEWGNRHGDPSRRCSYIAAIQPLYRTLLGRGYRAPTGRRLTAQREKHVTALRSSGDFERISCELVRWKVERTSAEVTELWSTFSEVISLAPKRRRWFLTEMRRVADEEFGGKVVIPILTPVYTARRR